MGIRLRLRNMVPGVDWLFDEDGAECAGYPSSRTTHSKRLIYKNGGFIVQMDTWISINNRIIQQRILESEGMEEATS